MRILIHDYGAYAFTAQLARSLAQRGHEVSYLHSVGMNTPRAGIDAAAEGNVSVHGIAIQGYRRGAGLRRLLQEHRYGSQLAEEIAAFRPDVVISANSPLDVQAGALRGAHDAGSAFVHWCQDIYSLAVGRLLERRAGPLGRAVGARFGRLERWIAQRSDAVVVISEDFRPIVEAWRRRGEGVEIIANWAPLDEITPMSRDNAWSRRHGLGESTVLLYAGTLGRKHDPTLLVTLAEAVPEAQVLVASEGTGTERLREMTVPSNLSLLPMQSVDDVPFMLAAADILVALLEADAQVFSVPSKVLTYLCAGRPILAAMPRGNLAARTILVAGAGVVVEPADRERLTSVARALIDDPDGRTAAGLAARRYAEVTFDIEAITDRFEGVLSDAVNRSHARGGAEARYW